MTKATEYMKAAIDHAIARQAELHDIVKRSGGHCSGWTMTHQGEIKVDFIEAQGVSTFMPQHMRKSWTLNGKRIAAAKLEKILNA